MRTRKPWYKRPAESFELTPQQKLYFAVLTVGLTYLICSWVYTQLFAEAVSYCGTVSNPPSIITSGRTPSVVDIELEEYPQYTFRSLLDNTTKEYLTYKPGDLVSIVVEQLPGDKRGTVDILSVSRVETCDLPR